MRISNNFAHNKPNFGKILSVKTEGSFSPKNFPETAKVLKAFQESDAFTKFCEEHDVDVVFESKGVKFLPFIGKFTNPYAKLTLYVREKGSDKESTDPIKLEFTREGHRKCDDFDEKAPLIDLANEIKWVNLWLLKKEYNEAKFIQNSIAQEKAQNEADKKNASQEFKDIINSLLGK